TMDLAGLGLLAPSPPGQMLGAKALPAQPLGAPLPVPDAAVATAKFFPRWAGDDATLAALIGRLGPESPVALNERYQLTMPVDVARIDCPALVVESEHDDKDTHPPGQDKAVADFYGGDHVFLADASHCFMVDPDWQVGLNAILDWVRGLDG
ncbi:MAG: hypothetical protein VW405_10815, partial [Rhodospirillaceae bacterium]